MIVLFFLLFFVFSLLFRKDIMERKEKVVAGLDMEEVNKIIHGDHDKEKCKDEVRSHNKTIPPRFLYVAENFLMQHEEQSKSCSAKKKTRKFQMQ